MTTDHLDTNDIKSIASGRAFRETRKSFLIGTLVFLTSEALLVLILWAFKVNEPLDYVLLLPAVGLVAWMWSTSIKREKMAKITEQELKIWLISQGLFKDESKA